MKWDKLQLRCSSCSRCSCILELSFRIKSQSKAIYKPPFILFFNSHITFLFFVLISYIPLSRTAKMTAMAVPWLLPGTPRLAPRCVFQEVRREQALVCRQAYALQQRWDTEKQELHCWSYQGSVTRRHLTARQTRVVGGFLPSGR